MESSPPTPNASQSGSPSGQSDRKSASEETSNDQAHTDRAAPAEPAPKPLHVRCPHCHNSVEFPAGEEPTGIHCSVCGSRFSLIGDDGTITYDAAGGKKIASFQFLERVGVGKFGVVWKARDTQLQRIVAVKVPCRGQLDAAETEQFVREARSAAQVRHPNIVTVHEVGREGDSIYIVSEFIEGVALNQWLACRRMTPTEAAKLCLKLAEALQAAHQAGIVHRDLKPGNILIDLDGEPHIADFGLAKREKGEVTMTLDGQILGTPAYMSPEQARGEAHRADCRSDVYSLGVICYELLTGERPFRGDLRMLMYQVLHDEPASPRKLNSRVPRDLESICLKCLEKAPGRRYQTAGELAAEMKRFLAGQPVQAKPVGTLGRIWRWYRRHPDASVYAAGGYLTFTGLLCLVWGHLGFFMYALGFPLITKAGLLQIALLVVFVYTPMLYTGIQTLNNRRIALCLGVVFWLTGLVLCVAGLLGRVFDEETWGNPVVRAPLFTLLVTVCAVGMVLQIVAVISRCLSPFFRAD